MLAKLSDIPKLLISGVIFLFFAVSAPLFSQSDISGTINQYRKVVSVGIDNVTVTDATPFSVNDTVLLIQMSGGIAPSGGNGMLVDTVGTPGAYEFLIILNVSSNTVTFTQSLDNSFSPDGLLQLIAVPSYNTAVVSSPLTCDQWVGSSGTGGVLAFIVKRRLSLNAPINVDGKGYAGGAVSLGAGICYNDSGSDLFFYNASSNLSGFKGEGVANKIDNSSTDIYPGYAKGKAPAYTGGGGGNGYSSGGGGGSGYGNGANGEREFTICTGFFLPGGGNGFGIAGGDLDGNVFMGGGGGASTYPSTPNLSTGGNGGGIVIIFADTISGNGQSITANGATGEPNTVMGAGAGGGGGGGSIIIDTRHFLTNPVLNANGGNGGNTVNSTVACAGGGGGGGLIWTRDSFTGSSFVSGGANGFTGTKPPTFFGLTGRISTGLLLPLNGFLYNAIYTSKKLTAVDSICYGMVPPALKGTQPTGGTAPYTFQWQKSYDNNTWVNTSGTSMYYTPLTTETETATLYIRRVISDNAGLIDYSQPVQIVVLPLITDNIVSKDTTICKNQDPLALVPLKSPAGGNGVFTYLWLQSNNNTTWTDTNTPSASYDPASLASTTYYKRVVNSGACADTTSVVINVLENVGNNIITDNQTICQGNSFANLTGSSPSGGDNNYSYQWQSSGDGETWANAPGTITGINYDPTNDNPGSYYFSRIVLSGLHNCCVSTSNSVALVSYPEITNNSISQPQTICEGYVIAGLTGTLPLGGNGTYAYQWQKSTNGTTWNDIPSGTGQNHSGERVYLNTYYRRKVVSSECESISGTIFITIVPAVKNYSLVLDASAHDTICTGTIPGKISGIAVTGGTGSYSYTWHSSDDNINFTQLSTTDPDYQPGTLTTTTWFYRTVISGPCTVYDTVKITVLPKISGNTITGDQQICNVTSPAAITGPVPGGGDGKFKYIWQKRDTVTNLWEQAPGTYSSVNYTPPLLDRETDYRRIVFSGENNCCKDTSQTVTVEVDIMPKNVTAGPDMTLNPYQFAVTMQGYFEGTGNGLWSVISSQGDPVCENWDDPLTKVTKLGFGDNTLRWIVSNGRCTAEEDNVTFTVPKLTIPEGFSPNGDEYNQKFIIPGLEYTTNELIIINTGGAVVYKATNYRSDDPVNAWEGLDNNGDPLPEGTYYYLLTITGASDISIPKYVARLSGFIIIRR